MAFQGDAIFWVDTEKVVPNPFQPRREFDQNKLQELSESIRMYGVLQPLTVTRTEVQRDDGTFYTEYELIAGERRLRASRLAQVAQVPVIIREGEQSEQEKLELAIIENLQREDLNAIDRAVAFQQLAEQFDLSHTQVALKVQRSREYVSNSIRLLALPEHMQGALQRGELGEGHARTLLMLTDRPEEQETIFREILLKKMSVREVERIVRKIASDKVRKPRQSDIDDHLVEIEKEFTETLGTRVQILKTDFGGKLTIDYFSEEDLSAILEKMKADAGGSVLAQHQPQTEVAALAAVVAATPLQTVVDNPVAPEVPVVSQVISPVVPAPVVRPEPVMQPVAESVPVIHPQEPVVSIQASPDPSLLERLAAHTSFSFSRPEPQLQQEETAVQQTVPVAPAAIPEPVIQTDPVVSEAENTFIPPVQPDAPAITQPAPKLEEEPDLYSIRNFTV
jgi:ParB family chromosome partitioning protein